MTPSATLYHQIRWDDRFDPGRWTLGIEARKPEPKRVALVDFVPGGDIPWHRVLYFEADGVVVWDRRTGRDDFDSATVGRRTASARLSATTWTARPTLEWNGSRWAGAESTAAPLPSSVSLLTWNVLFDRFDDGRLGSAARRPHQADALAHCGAHIVALQEVEWPLLSLLMDHPEVRARYRIVTPGPERDIDDLGLVLLVAAPVVEAGFLPFGPHKGALAVVVDHWTGPVLVANTHLTSAHSADAPQRRAEELTALRRALDAIDADPLVLGDFNDSGEAPCLALGLTDRGLRVPTFDPARNALAAWSSLTGDARCIDRVLTSPRWATEDASLEFVETHDALPMSDHFGMRVTLAARTPAGTTRIPSAATPRTALAWLPPHNATIEAVRTEHDPAHARWPAHVNVVFGFMPEHDLEAAADAVQTVLSEHLPFSVRMGTTGAFSNARRTLRWAEVPSTPPEAWSRLAHGLDVVFPGCPRRHEYTPHLTLGLPPASLPESFALEAEVSCLTVLSRRADGPMVPRAEIPLGGGPTVWLDPAGPAEVPRETEARTEQARAIIARIEVALPECAVHVVGSQALSVPLVHSDIDLVVVTPSDFDLEGRLRERLPNAHIRPVHAARVPGLACTIGAHAVDIARVQLPSPGTELRSVHEAVEQRHTLPEPAERALSAVSDARALRDALAPHGPPGLLLLATIRAWARARGLHSRPLGGLPAVGWSVMVSRSLQQPAESGAQDLRSLLAHFFETFADWPTERPISLDGRWPGEAHLPLQVATPAAPVRACSDAVTEGMAKLIRHELLRGWEVCVEPSNTPLTTRLLAPPPLHRRHKAWALVSVHQPEQVGRVRGRMRALLDVLPTDAHIWPESWTVDGIHHTAIGLGRQPPTEQELTLRLSEWRTIVAHRGVVVAWKDGGALDPPVWPLQCQGLGPSATSGETESAHSAAD